MATFPVLNDAKLDTSTLNAVYVGTMNFHLGELRVSEY